ncbi:MFS transporter [Mycolicibacterium sp. 018/SC-01/001]|uniref:MFS transporter n=1 Tax=Mycolicibacterium sp. 018/SC-01/001 TaxID=2592069 RepID=UPI00117F0192|nr:MFS transporter [Mycolicibacterium sp. 018/SC-01/001]TRW81763.1 MFS transporter [Mycolicibacterium sp. 018/SC-01/001]
MTDTSTPSDQDIDAEVAALSVRGRRWLLTVAGLSVLLVISSMVALNAALPDIAVETSATQSQLTWVVDAYTLAMACLLLPAGALGDRYGRRGALLFGLLVFGLASAAPVVFDSPAQLIGARAVTGVGAAFVMPATLSLLTAAFPKSERTKAVGIWAGVAGSGAIAGFLGTGILLQHFSWTSVFIALAVAALLMFVMACTIGSSRDQTATPIDWIGAVLVGIAIAVFVVGLIEAPAQGWTNPLVLGGLAGGVILAAAFALVERRRRHPLLDVRLFAIPEFATGALCITILFLSNFGFFYLLMQYLQLVMGYSALTTAFALAPLVVPILALSLVVHLAVARIGLRWTLTAGLLLVAVGLCCARLPGADAAYLDVVWPSLIIGAGVGICTAPATTAIMNTVSDEKQGVASAVNDTARELGAAIGVAVAGSILAASYRTALAPQLSGFPAQVRDTATDSLAYALTLSERLGPQGDRLGDAARAAFLDANGHALLALAGIVAVSAAFIAVLAPGRDGKRLFRR